ncbi:hypothetical protein INT45_004384 [Circinella minor]|uniref:Uncharacterized protein n=1 Tax=Circinella minor TaxID=1195481 RepID=A0A8H7S883_9FUNG|nr:hypothetical protein INT45_004384 [Circinella minor]
MAKKDTIKPGGYHLDSTHKTRVSFLPGRVDCYLFSLVTRINVTNKGCPVRFFITNSESSFTIQLSWLKLKHGFQFTHTMIDCSTTEMNAISYTFGFHVFFLTAYR